MDGLSGAANVIAVIQLAGSIIEICGGYIKKVKNAKEDILRLQNELAGLIKVLQALRELLCKSDGIKLTTIQALFDHVTECNSTLTRLKEKIDRTTAQRPMSRWGFRALKWPLKSTQVDDTISHIEKYTIFFSLALEVDQIKATDVLDRKFDLGRLRIAKGASFDSYENQHTECLPGTRTDLLREIEDWTRSPDGKCIFWLNGMAGTGKSTISRTVANQLKAKGFLGATFFFKRGEEDRGNAKCLFPTLTDQLIRMIPQLVPTVRRTVEDDPNISEKALREQFEKLILEPLCAINQRHVTTMIVIIDALDECDREDDIRILLRLLPQVQKANSVQLRFLLTSRPELAIRLGFKGIANDHQYLILHEVPRSVIEHDITLYLQDQFSQLMGKRSLPSDWPGNEIITILVERATPLFISAVTLCRFISDEKWNPQKRLKAILADQTSSISKMDSTYMPVLNQLLTGQEEWESQQLVHEFKEVVGVVILLAAPLSANALAQLLELETDDVNNLLDQLHSVLDVPASIDIPVRLLHLSFRDFLLDPRKKSNPFWVDEKERHHKITTQCLQVMQHNLKKNICKLSGEGITCQEISKEAINQYLPAELQYSCRYWTQHLVQSQDPVTQFDDVFYFLQKHILHWMEAMCILGIISEILEAFSRLQAVIQDEENSQLYALLNDARRFILKNRQIAEVAPLQLYCSGLIFAPGESIIRKGHSAEIPCWIERLPKVEDQWSTELQTLEGHSGFVNSVAFSPDGRLLASASGDKTIKLWETATGTLQQTLKGHSSLIGSVAFSPDGRLLASASADKTIKFWETATGILQKTLEGHSWAIRSIAFSPNGKFLASASGDKTIKLWETATGTLQQTLEGRSYLVNSVVFSPDGQLLALASNNWTIELWETATGILQQTLEGHSDPVSSVAFSPDGQLLASASKDKTIKLWEIATGISQQIEEDHSHSVNSVAFSPDGRLLATASDNRKIKLWETTTGTLQQTLEGHSDSVNSVAFSPNGRLLVSASKDETVKLWEIATDIPQQIQEDYSHSVNSVAFSPDGRLLASVSDNWIIELWETETGKVQQTLEGHFMAFSPDGQLLASALGNKTIKLWKTTTGTLQQILEGHSYFISSVVFSPDGQLLASVSVDLTIKLWETATGTLQQTLEGRLVAFSPDGRLLASALDNQTVKLWETATGMLLQTLEGQGFISQLEFSKNSPCLETNLGPLTILPIYNYSTLIETPNKVEVRIFKDEWVTLSGKKVLWLPTNYRPTCSAVHNGTVALGHASGRISFLRFCQ